MQIINVRIKMNVKKRVSRSLLVSLLVMILISNFSIVYSAFPGENGKIAFVSDRGDSPLEIYSMEIDGSQQTKLTNIPISDEANQPAWSPDGEKIVYT
ncbi:hypothetical protein GF319_07435, partial [Candidatus Bathyarchaeota archaeon]|nr:hypothetical protein [Candidatus Bathyarchaeota archaeon]